MSHEEDVMIELQHCTIEELQANNKMLKGQVYILSKFLGEEEAKSIISKFEEEVQVLQGKTITEGV